MLFFSPFGKEIQSNILKTIKVSINTQGFEMVEDLQYAIYQALPSVFKIENNINKESLSLSPHRNNDSLVLENNFHYQIW